MLIIKVIMAGKAKTIPTISTIKDVWGKSDDVKKSESLELSFKMLQAKGNEDLIKKQIAVNAAGTALESAQQAALKTPDFNAIAASSLALEAAQLEFDRAKAVFVQMFGIDPTV